MMIAGNKGEIMRVILVVLFIGLFLFQSGQAQEQAEGEQGRPAQQQQPAQSFFPPIRIEIIEDQAAAAARERRETEARQHEIDDLVAQQGMNAATQAINEATQDMRDYAFYSTILVGIGTFLLVITLRLTRQANRAAIAAVEATQTIGRAQTRAYVAVRSVEFQNEPFVGHDMLAVVLDNTGMSPAISVKVAIRIEIRDPDDMQRPISELPTDFESVGHLGANVREISHRFAEERYAEEYAWIKERYRSRDYRRFVVIGTLRYETVFEEVYEVDFMAYHRGRAGGGPLEMVANDSLRSPHQIERPT